MADENISDVQRQLSAAMQQQADDYARYGKMQVSTAETLKDTQIQAATGLKNYTAATGMAGKAVGALAGAGVAAAAAMYQGKKGMGAFNSSLDSLSEAATLAGAALTLLMPGGIIMKAVIGGLTMAATAAIAYTKAANDMADKLYKSYSGLQQSGAAASDGMTGVFNDAKKLGLSMDELDSMVSLVAANSQDLILFGGTVADGRRQLADMSKAMEGSREGFFKLGMSQQAQNEAMAGYMKLSARTGNAQKQTTEQLAASARNYITEQDALARITGMGVKDQQKAREDALMEEQFLAKVRQLQREGKFKEAKELQDANVIMSAMGAEVGKGFRATVNGNLRDENARKYQMATQGKGMEASEKLANGQINAAEAAQMVGKGFQSTLDGQADQLATLGVVGSYMTDYSQMVKGAAMSQSDIAKTLDKSKADQAKTLAGKGDSLTNAQGEIIKTEQEINEKLERDVLKGIPNAQANMKRLANVTDTLANGFTTLTNGINRLLKLVGLGEKEPEKPKEMTTASAEAAKATASNRNMAKPLQDRVDKLAKELDADEKALKDAKRAGKYGDELKPLEEKILKNKGEYEKATKELIDAENKIRQSAQEEGKIRLKQMNDRKKLARLEHENLDDAEKIKDLNEEKANLVKQGKSTTAIDKKIDERKANIAGRSAEVGQLQSSLKTSVVSPKSSGGGGGASSSRNDLEAAGIVMKKGDVQKESSVLSPNMIELAKNIQSNTEGFKYFSAFNDNFHNEKASSSKHTDGLAADFVLASQPNKAEGAKLVSRLKEQGASMAIDEYNNPSSKATAGHIHVEIPAFADGGLLEAGRLGIAGEAGPEFVKGPASITPMGDMMGVFNNMAMLMGQQAGALEELIRIAKNGNDISTKILRQQA